MNENACNATIKTSQVDVDVLVAGGGPAGIAAAIAAARCGATVALCQDRPMLGGNASSEIRMHIVGADCSGKRGAELTTEAREGGIIEEIRLEAAARNAQRSSSMFDLILYEKCKAEPKLRLFLNTTVIGAKTSGGIVRQAIAQRQSTEEQFVITAKVFIDCTGDGRLGVEAGAAFREGRESSDEFGESLAVQEADQRRLGSTIMFQARRHDRPMPFTPPASARRFSEQDLRLRPHAESELDRGLEYGYWWVEWGGCLDTIRDNEQIRDELLSIVMGVWDHVKNGGDHGAENWALEWFGFVPGKRESRRFTGRTTLSETDVMRSRRMPDAIAFGGWPIDVHPPEGVDAPDEPPCTQHDVPALYDIPLRCCVSGNLRNLMFAGRNISATHIAFASTRVMATCAAMGQGVGTAAAIACDRRQDPADLFDSPTSIQQIQQRLLRDDAYLIGVKNEDDHDLARLATFTASSEISPNSVRWITSGQTRSVHGDDGAPADRANPGVHRWRSNPLDSFPVSLEMSWPQPIRAANVRIIFDSGLHRVLTFSLADAYTEKMKWGVPQPELVRDYRIEVRRDHVWSVVAEIRDNYQRLRDHSLDQAAFDALRLTIDKTNGIDHARVCEIRVEQA
ncbi:FAD-dependent oxidoreductase [Blastopirellula marina]|uniref:Putative pyridine nucleotide-disulphide oxidoreductase n=1 Tax=Blastopirellula marina DSM 3645 TaxID=314230 RepID=A3ZY94_9BACT|nr:FAD-dependent oxidoreductase [Blastopirellula marina]EAQ78570.1 putative pyridine nucleotide-disulphide oxidoreductase [Blastopirellula marina DSM 3645]